MVLRTKEMKDKALGRMKCGTMNPHIVFRNLRKIFGVQSYTSIATLADWDSAHVSKMRSGQQRISASFFLKLCFAKNWTPKKMMDECGIDPGYFWRSCEQKISGFRQTSTGHHEQD